MFTEMLRRRYTRMAHANSCRWETMNLTGTDLLHVSELGSCKRAPLLRIQSGGSAEKKFTPEVYDKILSGIVWGDFIAKVIAEEFEYAATEVPVINSRWSGKIDVLTLYPCHVVELKDTSVFNFRYGRLPYLSHVMQVMAYTEMIRDQTQYDPKSVLFYHGRGHMAEFTVSKVSDTDLVHIVGHIDNAGVNDTIELDIEMEMKDLESSLDVMRATGVLPKGEDSPFEGYQCCDKSRDGVKKSCPFFDACWKIDGEEPFSGREDFEDRL